jgi:PAS domain S-box-containing protein/CSLREA domain-containing protein
MPPAVSAAAPPNSGTSAVVAQPAQPAASIEVNSTVDGDNLNPGAGCDTDAAAPGEQCSLRAAIQRANALAGDDEITFNIPATEANCDAAKGICTINLTKALPEVSAGLRITGPGADKLTVRRHTGGNYRIFAFGAGVETATISGLTISKGYTSEAGGKNFFDLRYPDDLAAKLQRQIRQVFDTGQGLTDETPYTSQTGKGGYYEYIFRPVLAADGMVEMVAGSTRDITERKRAAEALRESEERYHRLFDSIDEGFCVIEMLFDEAGSPVDYRFLEINPAFEQQTGLGLAVGRTIREMVPDHDQWWFETFGQVALTGEPVRFEDEATAMGRWFDVFASRLGGPGSRKVALLFNDITRRKRAEEERERLLRTLELERERLTYLFANAPAFVAVLRGPDHVFELVNPPYVTLVGGRKLLGKTAREALPEVEGQGYFRMLDHVYRTGEAHVGKEMKVLLGRGEGGAVEDVFVNFVYQPIFEADGSVSGIFVHGVDITDQVKARKEAEAANRLKDEFLATLSHELRTPLTAVLGWTRMLRGGNLDELTAAKALDIIERNAEAQQQLIEDVLDVSRIITGKLRLDVRPVELVPVVEAAVDAVKPAAEAKNIELSVSIDPEANLVSADPTRLQQVVWNLLTNAIKFTPKEGRVEVRLERMGSNVRIKVIDNGLGISQEFLPHVFNRFRQADSSTMRRYGGLGLGLAVVRHLVEQHGGSVSAESEGEYRGSTFTIELPVSALRVEADEFIKLKGGVRAGDRREGAAPSLKGVRALIVEDQEDARELLSVLLQQYGTEVVTAGSAVEALSALRRERPDVLVSDIGMPEEDGYWLIREVRSLGADLGGDVPAVALTAYASEADRERALAAGFQAHVSKPIEPSALISAVAGVVGRGTTALPLPNNP